MNNQIFNIDNVNEVKNKIITALNYPYKHIQHSTLGGNDNISIIISLSLESPETWCNQIFENSLYIKIYISNTGYIELISQSHKLKRFRAGQIKDIDSLINKIKKQVIIRED